jgi:hypothetical protein
MEVAAEMMGKGAVRCIARSGNMIGTLEWVAVDMGSLHFAVSKVFLFSYSTAIAKLRI